MEARVIIRVELFEEGRLEDAIGGVHRLKDVIARGAEEDTDRGDTAGGCDLQDATDKTHGE